MSELYSILFKKESSGATVKDSLREWNIACVSAPFDVFPQTKELPANDWMDEDGEDTFIPDSLRFSAYDHEIEFCYKGDNGNAYNSIKSFIDYLSGRDGSGASVSVYSPYTKIGRQKMVFEGTSDMSYTGAFFEEVLLFSVKFRVTDPVTDIVL